VSDEPSPLNASGDEEFLFPGRNAMSAEAPAGYAYGRRTAWPWGCVVLVAFVVVVTALSVFVHC
jgi:hypothetical protein